MVEKTAEEVVRAVLKKHEEARESQQMMFYYVMKEVMNIPLGKVEKEKFEDFFRLTSLVRAMRHIQNDKEMYQPSEMTKMGRRKKAERMKKENGEGAIEETRDIGQASLDLFGSLKDEGKEKKDDRSLVEF